MNQTFETLLKEKMNEYGYDALFIKERNDFHPEYSLFHHILTVIDNVSEYNNINLSIAALYHDLGKVFTYKTHKNSYGHELTSTWLLMEDYNRLKTIKGFDYDIVHWIVLNHLKAGKIIDNIKSKDDYKLLTNKNWKTLERFAHADNMLNTYKNISMFENKKVFVSVENDYFVGNCDFIGYNVHLKHNQITLDRQPIRLNNFNLVCSFYDLKSF